MSTKPETRTVVAVSDPVPMEGGGIIESTPVAVPESWYYRRAIADGSLREVIASETTPAIPAGPTVESAPAATTKKVTA